MWFIKRCLNPIFFLTLIFTACSVEGVSSTQINNLDRQQVIDIVWQTLEPNTSSHDQAAWEVIDVHIVTGKEVQDLFTGKPIPGGCVRGPTPPDNAAIDPTVSYWYVQMKPRFATPQPQPKEEFSPTAPPKVPEPFLIEAHFLIDKITGKVVARKLNCVIY